MAEQGYSSPKILYPDWQQAYQAALLELDPQKLSELVATAEAAIFNRRQAISQSRNHVAERQAIEDALASRPSSKQTISAFLIGERSSQAAAR